MTVPVKITGAEVHRNEAPDTSHIKDNSDHFEQAHHTQHRHIPQGGKKYGVYVNIGVAHQQNTDLGLLANLVNNSMGSAVMAATLGTSGTLGGLMTSMAIGRMVPPIGMLTTCLACIAIELDYYNISADSYNNINRKNFKIPLKKETQYLKFKKISPIKNDPFETYPLKSLVGTILSAFVLFDEATKDYGVSNDSQKIPVSEKLTKYQIQINCFNIAHSFTMTQPSYASHGMSMAHALCSIAFGLNMCTSSEGGSGYHMLRYYHYTSKLDYKIHNVLLHNLYGGGASYITYLSRLMFCSTYSQQELHVKLSQTQRAKAILPDSTIIFNKYLFEDLNNYEDLFTDSTAKDNARLIGFDTIDAAIQNQSLEESLRDERLSLIYMHILNLAKNVKDLYYKVTRTTRNCPRDYNAALIESANEFQRTVPIFNTKFILNTNEFSDIEFDQLDLLNQHERANVDVNWKKVLIPIIGNSIAIGMRQVGQQLYNFNLVTFDYYYRYASLNDLLQASVQLKALIKNTDPSSYSNLQVDLDVLEKIFNRVVPVSKIEQDEMDALRKSIDPLVEFSQQISSLIPSFKKRIVQTKI